MRVFWFRHAAIKNYWGENVETTRLSTGKVSRGFNAKIVGNNKEALIISSEKGIQGYKITVEPLEEKVSSR